MNAPLTFPITHDPYARPPSPRKTRRQSSNLPAVANTTPSFRSLSSKYRRSDLEVMLSDYALNLFPEATITTILQSLLKDSRTAAWYSRFFFLRPQNEEWHSRISRFLLLVYTKTLERPRFEAGRNDEWRKLVKSIHFIPLTSGKLHSVEENKRVGLYAAQDKKGRLLVEPGMDWKVPPIQVIDLGAWRNQESRKLIETVRHVVR
ncbi:hypothetical protein QBC41DRAFT_325525 [Cercophora samala]|uniref:Uncharacterized protein n=1 Tax=Cercophora samala TaxID=330535 RepID=A0AA40DAC0_9PEZI|nr:hypothetical protein QBC41DRAFT_325525 [Cercophora samala]